jgi:methionyl-tRNA synthetase
MAKQHFKEIAQRIVNAEAKFVSTLMERGGIDASAAEKVFGLYKKHKLIKLDAFHGVYSVKHGAFLNHKTINNAVAALSDNMC